MLRFGVVLIIMFAAKVYAADMNIGDQAQLIHSLNHAQAGDKLILQKGLYTGPLQIKQSIELVGEPGAIIDGQGKGSAIEVFASHVTINGVTIQNWGQDHYERDSGILIYENLEHIKIVNSHLSGNSFGIRADEVQHINISQNQIRGNAQMHKLDRGDGIYLKHVKHSIIVGNTVTDVRDGVYIDSSQYSLVTNNTFSNQQYGIHYMYSKHDEAFHNTSYQVDGGFALMSSDDIYLHHNRSWDALDFGVLLNMTKNCRIISNQIKSVHNANGDMEIGTVGKGLFIYAATDNIISGNLFDQSDVGIYMAMGGETNQIYGNGFSNNQTQIKYVGDVVLEWSHQQQGNYWSSYQGWDYNGDGIGDSHYRPNDSLDKLFWLYPEAKFLMNSPIVQMLKWVQKQFYLPQMSGIVDSFPLLQPPTISLDF
ncbi:nitrous oxide reductase family maturation protein NosD [Shewanella marina]|uniref:nitrous oxide reductase family maturation protein NosD n=1 Tax=Shewanella marina TaxID=487319 RepID=UPI00046FB822|nr:nitrous oxide reductase family maturation protein NosD [Shewanella marina]